MVLASASPARRRILEAAGIDPEVIVSGVDESAVDASSPDALCLVLARLKAHAVADRLSMGRSCADHRGGILDNRPVHELVGDSSRILVLGCDSVLALGGSVHGKPADAAEAIQRWRSMRGRDGVLHTGHCLVDLSTGRSAEAVAATTVSFAEPTDEEIAAYVATGEPLRVAGAFTIDGIGGPFVERIDGDPGTVVGLSLPLLRRLLAQLDLSVTALWRRS